MYFLQGGGEGGREGGRGRGGEGINSIGVCHKIASGSNIHIRTVCTHTQN